jgi:hypothetical protein
MLQSCFLYVVNKNIKIKMCFAQKKEVFLYEQIQTLNIE